MMRGVRVTAPVFCSILLSAVAIGLACSPLQGQSANERRVCEEVEERYVQSPDKSSPRVLNFLLFDAAERGCLDLAEQFISEGASVAARNGAGNTALLIAAHMGHAEVIEFLLAKGAAIDQRNLAGSTALLNAATANRRRAVKSLLEAGADVAIANNRGVTPLIAAVFGGHDAIVRSLLEAGADAHAVDATGKGPVVYAAARGFASLVKLLLEAGVDVNRRYGNDLTALMWAAGYANDVPLADGLETVELLLGRGARQDLADNRGRTALMIAAERGHAEVVARLIAAGADRSARDKDGRTALDLAASEAVRLALSP
jgi:ankyrin repeat protein